MAVCSSIDYLDEGGFAFLPHEQKKGFAPGMAKPLFTLQKPLNRFIARVSA
jgi:hypothetical protein